MSDDDGVDRYGYPRATVDRVRLLALLHHRRFDELARHLEALQTDFESDHRREYWPIDGVDAFFIADPAVTPLLDQWAARVPQSFAPWAARGAHWRAVANQRRGSGFISETSQEQLRGMRDAHARATVDLRKALSLRPKLVAAYRHLIAIGQRHSASEGMEESLEQALKICPSCFQVRVTYITALTPRWGGSYPQMAAFAEQAARQSRNPKLRLLAGYADWDRCGAAVLDKDWAGARRACDAAVAVGEHWQFLHERGDLRAHMKDHEGALQDLARARALRPGEPDVVIDHARALASLGQHEQAIAGLRAAQKLDPAEESLSYAFNHLVARMVEHGYKLEQAARYDQARALYARALAIDPKSERARSRAATAAILHQLLQATVRSPADVQAHVRLDHQLARERRFDEVVEMWTRFLARHPREPRAYLERGGAYYNMGKKDLALADTDRACNLGLPQACAIGSRVRAQ